MWSSNVEKKAEVTVTLKACGGPAICQRSSVPAQHSLISTSPSTKTILFLILGNFNFFHA